MKVTLLDNMWNLMSTELRTIKARNFIDPFLSIRRLAVMNIMKLFSWNVEVVCATTRCCVLYLCNLIQLCYFNQYYTVFRMITNVLQVRLSSHDIKNLEQIEF